MNAAVTPAWQEAIERSTNLVELEAIVQKGRSTFLEVGAALVRIHQAQLYKLTHSTWEGYCEQRWGWSRQHAYRLMTAAKVAVSLSPEGIQVPSERHARELARLPPEQRQEAWQEAVASVDPEQAKRRVHYGRYGSLSETEQAVGRRLTKQQPDLPGVPAAPRKSTQDRRTPRWLFDALNEMFGPFVLDAYATAENALCERFHTVESDGNAGDWEDVTFANPEFKAMDLCTEHAVEQAELGCRSIVLGPVGCSQDWYHRWAIHGTVYVPDCRINYDDPAGNPTGSGLDEGGADRDTIVMAFGGEHQNHPANVDAGVFRVRRLELKRFRP